MRVDLGINRKRSLLNVARGLPSNLSIRKLLRQASRPYRPFTIMENFVIPAWYRLQTLIIPFTDQAPIGRVQPAAQAPHSPHLSQTIATALAHPPSSRVVPPTSHSQH